MFVEDGAGPTEEPFDAPQEIAPAVLLAACAAEAERQAADLRKLDAALGAALIAARRQSGAGGGKWPPDWTADEPGGEEGAKSSGRATDGGAPEAAALVPALVADLQLADQIRQEAEGLAKVLALLAGRGDSDGCLSAAQVRACTPVSALQRRLLAPVGTCPPQRRDGAAIIS
ncbi:hypothetical protein [Paragemmobacter ruber]|nr:hypothetical protein [Rhodobacter ruber]